MKNFMAVFTGSPTSEARQRWDRLEEAERKQRQAAGMKAWQDWVTRHQSIIVDGGGPLGKTKRIARDGVTDIRNNLAAYVVVRAESHEAAARLFENHPHFSIFPGDAVEVMECLPVPMR
ncbi:MAG TPA: hypothetical protein VMF64_15775 [Steroidobacteraceae bacterium]|nr:hypothetical protein [Steroidobacteraceae bacterium]